MREFRYVPQLQPKSKNCFFYLLFDIIGFASPYKRGISTNENYTNCYVSDICT